MCHIGPASCHFWQGNDIAQNTGCLGEAFSWSLHALCISKCNVGDAVLGSLSWPLTMYDQELLVFSSKSVRVNCQFLQQFIHVCLGSGKGALGWLPGLCIKRLFQWYGGQLHDIYGFRSILILISLQTHSRLWRLTPVCRTLGPPRKLLGLRLNYIRKCLELLIMESLSLLWTLVCNRTSEVACIFQFCAMVLYGLSCQMCTKGQHLVPHLSPQ